MAIARVAALALMGLLLPPLPVPAQAPARPLRVATRVVPPFVFEDKGKLAGFSIDLWQNISEEIKARSELAEHPTVVDLLAAVKSGKSDLGIAAISITAERSREFDFSQPMFDSGLQILVRDQPGGGSSVRQTLSLLLSSAALPFVGLTLLFVLVPAHIVWLSERRHPRGMIESRSYFPGIFEACWWAASTLATQADQMPRSALGRAMAILWMFTAVLFVAYFTATVTSSLTVQQLQGDINGPEDLPGKQVATTTGSTSAAYLRQHNIETLEFPRIEQAYEALLKGQADAVVFDAPVLLFYAAREGKGKVNVVGSVFRKESYGIVFPQNSPYRRPVNAALLKLKEDGTYQRLYDKWFAAGR
ncbi:MAG TPA: transporter substrate-binding domain-containing protein [Candidatus Binatia bacterium]